MTEVGEDLPLAAQTLARIARRNTPDQLDRDATIELRIDALGEKYRAHAATADLLDQHIGAESRSHRWVLDDGIGNLAEACGQAFVLRIMHGHEREHLGTQTGIAFIASQPFGALTGRHVEQAVEQFLQTLPAAVAHACNGSTSAGTQEGIIENTTFHGNTTTNVVGTSSALTVYQGALTVRNSTFANNIVSPNAPSQRSDSGAVWGGSNAQVKLVSVLFDRNSRGTGNDYSDLARVGTTSLPSTLDVANSLLRSGYSSSVITSQSAPNLFATDALLLPLDTSIGLAPIVPISRLSPAIDRGVNPGNLTTDQRGAGFARAWSDPNYRNVPGLSKPDIGAYEYRGDAIFVGDFEQR